MKKGSRRGSSAIDPFFDKVRDWVSQVFNYAVSRLQREFVFALLFLINFFVEGKLIDEQLGAFVEAKRRVHPQLALR